MLANTAARMVARFGAAYTLKRTSLAAGANAWTAGAPASTFYPCKARETGAKPYKLQGHLAEAETLIVIDAASLAVEPKKGDQIARGTYSAPTVAGWAHVVNVDAGTDGNATRVWRLLVKT